jgi:hypothetical protein
MSSLFYYLKETFFKCVAIFFVWFTTVFAFGLAICVTLKILKWILS